MKVGLFSLKGNFSSYEEAGPRFYRYAYQLYNLMKGSDRDIIIEKREIAPGILGTGFSYLFKTMFMDMQGFDIVHNIDFKPFYPLRKSGAITVTTAHDFFPILRPDLVTDAGRGIKGKLWLELILKGGIKDYLHADYMICNSTLTRDDAVKLGYDKKRTFVVSMGIDRRFFSPVKKRTGKKFIVGYLGVLKKIKNVGFAIRAFKHINASDIRFDIWGSKSSDYEYLASLAQGDNRIGFMGYAPDDKIVQIYDSFDVFIFPTLYEGVGIPLLEAQARGVPVIIYKGGKVPKEITKYCFEARDEKHAAEIIKMLKDKGFDEKHRKKMIAYARSFTWEKVAKDTLDVYKQIMKRR